MASLATSFFVTFFCDFFLLPMRRCGDNDSNRKNRKRPYLRRIGKRADFGLAIGGKATKRLEFEINYETRSWR